MVLVQKRLKKFVSTKGQLLVKKEQRSRQFNFHFFFFILWNCIMLQARDCLKLFFNLIKYSTVTLSGPILFFPYFNKLSTSISFENQKLKFLSTDMFQIDSVKSLRPKLLTFQLLVASSTEVDVSTRVEGRNSQ